MWIYRDLSNIIKADLSFVQILLGPRQTGKSSLLLHLEADFVEISFDDSTMRALAAKDPLLFLQQYKNKKMLIDEAHLVPEIFSAIKRQVDLLKRTSIPNQTVYRVTGSNQILIDKNVKESLAGRASYFKLNTLSVSEIISKFDIPIFEIIYKGGFPEIYSRDILPKKFLDNYISTYIEKDIVLSAGISKSHDFIRLCRLLGSRVGQLINYSGLSQEIGVEPNTIKAWVHSLEKMGIIALIEPFAANLSKRIVKSSKVYFLDTGLACRLQGWSDFAPIMTSPYAGFLFENLVLAELIKIKCNFSLDYKISHWRTKDQEEIDFILSFPHRRNLMIECKVSPQDSAKFSSYRELSKEFKDQSHEIIVCHAQGERKLGSRVPIALLKDYILEFSKG